MKEESLLLLSDLQKLINQVVLIDYTIIILGGVYMATSSITKNFIISGQKQVEMFVDAIEASAKNRPVRVPVSAREITDEAELIELMDKWEKKNVSNG